MAVCDSFIKLLSVHGHSSRFKLRVSKHRTRTGSALVLGLLLSLAVIGLTAVSMDLGYIRIVQAELRRSADAAAMAGCWDLYQQYQEGITGVHDSQSILDACNAVAQQNSVGESYATLSEADVDVGSYESGGELQLGSLLGANAVRVTLRRDALANGELPLFFGALTGRSTQSLRVSATAAMFQSINGFYLPDSDDSLNLLPIALDLETWLSAVEGATTDHYQYLNGEVVAGADGHFEANLYPQGTGSPGNRGTVDIGGEDNSTNDLSRQVLHGVSRQDLLDLGKPLEFDSAGELILNGDTGISAGIKDELATLVGQVRIIPIYSHVFGNGNNASFTIVRWEGVRILDVKLTGKKETKRVIVQPQKVLARNARVDHTGSSVSTHVFTPVILVE